MKFVIEDVAVVAAAGAPKENGVVVMAGAVLLPKEKPGACAAWLPPKPPKEAAVEAAWAPNPPMFVVVNPGVVRENAGADVVIG